MAKRYEELADALDDLSLHERADGNGKLSREYQLAASALRTAEHIPPDPSDIGDVGIRTRDAIAEWRAYGELDRLTELREKRPYLSSLCGIAKVGPSTADNLYNEFGAESVDDVKQLNEDGKLEEVSGIGPKTATTIRRSISQL